ncbi:alcohol dehydogenase [Lenzites betulinus]|nr:alcohol dehydogenase [Lenzites betulinus]
MIAPAPADVATSTPGKTMVAWRIVPGLSVPQRTILPIPTPAVDEVLVKVLAAGVCHSDVHLLEWSTTHPFAPHTHTLGHEGAGIIVGLGERVAAETPNPPLALGTFVAVLTTNACEQPDCDRCSRGFANVCFMRPMIGLNSDGCWAEYVVARASTVVPVPGNNPKSARLAPGIVAAATDAVMTPWHALTRAARVQPGQTVLVFGCGGLGINAIQIAKHVLGAGTVVVSDVREESLATARRVGADHAVMPSQLKAFLEEKGLLVDIAIDLVGKQVTLDASVDLVRSGGTVLLIGLGDDVVSVNPLAMTTKQLKIVGSFGGDSQDLADCLQAIEAGKVVPEVEERPMDECIQVVEDLAAGRIQSRIALIP